MNGNRFQEQFAPPVSEAKNETSKAAIVSLVCGVLGLVGFGLIGLFVVGIIAGLVALSKIRKSGGTLDGQGLAIAGLILNAFSAVITIVFYVFFLSGVLFYLNNMNGANQHRPVNVNTATPAR